MRIYNLNKSLIFIILLLTFIITGCSEKEEKQEPSDIWDIDKSGIPRFVGTNYIELNKIYRISKFRSSVGHNYADAFEQCRSMKHYFEPKSNVDWSTIKIFSPVKGIITRIDMEWAGAKIEIASEDYPAFRFSIFHVNTMVQHKVGGKVLSGEQLGTHIGSQTMSDISVMVNDPTQQGRLVSYFSVITDVLFNEYSSRGVIKREDMIIPKTTRDANPLSCNGDTFNSADRLENWIILN